jgi:formamidopyrimidine-DNA glycosylase
MPELPDLQVFSRNLDRELRGKNLEKISVPFKKKLNVSEKELKTSLEGQSVEKVFREGKELYIQFKNGSVLGLHMMLRGKLHFFDGVNSQKYPIVEMYFKGKGLVLTDFQGQAVATLNPKTKESPDALSDEVDFNFLKKQLASKKAAIKNVLLDQNVIRGIGNAYADEILWDAGISPFSASNKIPDVKLKALAKSIKSVLLDAEKQIVKSNPDIIGGEVRDFLKIHNSKKKESPTGASINFAMASSRKTYYTDEQQLFE